MLGLMVGYIVVGLGAYFFGCYHHKYLSSQRALEFKTESLDNSFIAILSITQHGFSGMH